MFKKKLFITVLFFLLISCGEQIDNVSQTVFNDGINVSADKTTGNISVSKNGKILLTMILPIEVINKETKTLFLNGFFKFIDKIAGKSSKNSVYFENNTVFFGTSVTMYIGKIKDDIYKFSLNSKEGNAVKLNFKCDDNDYFMGFGAQTFKTNQKGESFTVWVEEEGIGKYMSDEDNPLWFFVGDRNGSYYPLPYFYNPKGYGFLLNSPYRTYFNLCKSNETIWSVEVDNTSFDFIVFTPNTPLEMPKLYTDLTGKPIKPKPWYFSPWNDAIEGKDEISRVMANIRNNKIPSSVIWTEDWTGDPRKNGDLYSFVYDWAEGRDLYPNIETTIADVHSNGFYFLAYFNTFIDEKSDAWQECYPDYFVKNKNGEPYTFIIPTFDIGGLLDLTNPEAVSWGINKMLASLSLGFDGWMADYGEWLPYDSVSKGGDGAYLHNIYPLLWHKMNKDVMKSANKDIVYFTRSGYIGDQALTTVYWPGDQRTDFEEDDGFPNAILTALNISWTGMVMFGSDIAGYLSVGNAPSDRELFYRWTEFGAFTPVMRTHHGSEKDKNWSFDKDENTIRLYKKYAIIHQKLFPYLYSEAISSGADGIPLIRQMYMEFNNPQLINMDSQYMLGPFMLVAPVMVSESETKEVYLPKGIWYDFWSGEKRISKGEWITAYAPIDEIPVFVKAGSIIEEIASDIDTIEAPVNVNAGITTLADRDNWRELYLYPGTDSTWRDYEGNKFSMDKEFVIDTASKIVINGKVAESCENGRLPCYFLNGNQIITRVKSEREKSIIIKTDGQFIIETDKVRIWEIRIVY